MSGMRALVRRTTIATAVLLTGLVTVPNALAVAPTLGLGDASVVYGSSTTAAGTIEALAGVTIEIEQQQGVAWVSLGSDLTDGTGAYSTTVSPTRTGAVRARRTDDSTTSASLALDVLPNVTGLGRRWTYPFVGTRLYVRIQPSTWTGRIRLQVANEGRYVATRYRRPSSGRVDVTLPTPGIDDFRVAVVMPAANNLSRRTVYYTWRVRGRSLSQGASGKYVVGMHEAIGQLKIYSPTGSSTFSARSVDSVIAFHKAYGLDRTTSWSVEDWRRASRYSIRRPRYSRPSQHIEVDKTRQVMIKVRNGRTWRIIPVSTGATGNTPTGTYSVLWKAPATGTWLGPGILYRTMTFYRGFAIHGWESVPTYPASHGCVRVPIWMADWLYDRTPVGERVILYF